MNETANLRDQFAMHALTGELACQTAQEGVWGPTGFPDLAERCYQIADAMLAARSDTKAAPSDVLTALQTAAEFVDLELECRQSSGDEEYVADAQTTLDVINAAIAKTESQS